MSNIFNDDFRDFLSALNATEVEYLLIGGYSVILHGYPRTTGDMDLWVNKTKKNYQKLCKSFLIFGMPVFDMSLEKFINSAKNDVFSFGRPPSQIDILTNVKGLNFKESFANHIKYQDDDLTINLIHYNDLIRAKKAAGRPRDLNDIEQLERK